jgi:hypothetical protein
MQGRARSGCDVTGASKETHTGPRVSLGRFP